MCTWTLPPGSFSPGSSEVICCRWRWVLIPQGVPQVRGLNHLDHLGDLEARLAGPTLDQLTQLWENVPSLPPWWTSLLSPGSLSLEPNEDISLLPVLPEPLCLSLASASAELVLCILRVSLWTWKRRLPASGPYLIHVSTSNDPSPPFDENQGERGLCAVCWFIGYKMIM